MQKKFNLKQIHILNIAEALIAQKGFKETSIRDISGKANVNVAMISYYFGSKDKMMDALYEYRVLRSKEKFSEFVETIKNSQPNIQLKEIINFVVSEILRYKHFHGFVTQEMQNSESTRNLLTDFYLVCSNVVEKNIEKGISIGVFKKAVKAEDLLSTIIGTVLFTIRNKGFYGKFMSCSTEYLPSNIEDKVKSHLQNTAFSLLGYDEV